MRITDFYQQRELSAIFSHAFAYHATWLATADARPISLSMPLRQEKYEGAEVFNFFDNLLPDNRNIRERVAAKFQAKSLQPFDLLYEIGRDCVGAPAAYQIRRVASAN